MANCSECKFGLKGGLRCSLHWSPPVSWYASCHLFEQKGAKMTFCGDCREWKPTEHNKDWGWCPDSQLEKHKSEEACGCIYLKREESMMGTCKECKWWEKSWSRWGGLCSRLGVGREEIVRWDGEEDGISNTQRPYTFESFGCVHFEQKNKGPFFVDTTYADGKRWVIYFRNLTAEPFPRSYSDQKDADELCSWLNKHWRN